MDSDYTVEIKKGDEVIFKQTYARESTVQIPLKQLKNERVDVKIRTTLKYMDRSMYVNREQPKRNVKSTNSKNAKMLKRKED